jgi:hypothetical protein
VSVPFYPSPIAMIVNIFCIWEARELTSAWDAHPLMKGTPLAFLIWLAPIIFYYINSKKGYASCSTFFLYLALLTTAVGMMGELNILKHLGVAFSLASLIPPSFSSAVWLVTSITWMSMSAYFMRGFDFDVVMLLRLSTVTLASLWCMISMYNDSRTI